MVHWFDRLPSTQDEAHRQAADGAPHGTAIAARIQTAGRGTRGRYWVSSAGGLWLSVIARPVAGEGIPVLSVRIGIALAEYLDSIRRPATPPVGLKWPNDLLLDDRKLGGVLCEARWHGDRLGWIVVGVGLNVHNTLLDITDRHAARLADHGYSGDVVALGEALAGLVARVTHSATPLSDVELAAFDVRDSLSSRP